MDDRWAPVFRFGRGRAHCRSAAQPATNGEEPILDRAHLPKLDGRMEIPTSLTPIGGLRIILRALVEARNGPFGTLWDDLLDGLWTQLPEAVRINSSIPKIEFRIYPVGDDSNVLVTVGVSAKRPDGIELSWCLTVQTEGDEVVVAGEVAIGDDDEVFSTSEQTNDPVRAAQHIASIAEKVCAHRDGLEQA